MNRLVFLFTLIVTCSASSVSCVNVKAYQRGVLSQPEMQFDFEKTENAAREHFLNSLEGSSGGFGTGGGGCGCN